MAQKTKAKIILLEIKPTKYWQFSSWDAFIVPKPFGTLHYYATGPIDVSSMELQEAKNCVQAGLLRHE